MDCQSDCRSRMCRTRQTRQLASAAEWNPMLGWSALVPSSARLSAAAAAALIASRLPQVPLILHLRLSVATPLDTAAASACWQSLNTRRITVNIQSA